MSLLSQCVMPTDRPQIITSRVIAAPRELIWKVLTLLAIGLFPTLFRQRWWRCHPPHCAHMAPKWPLEMMTIFDFISEAEKQTRLKISWINARVTDEEAKTFAGAHAGMTGGWTGSLNKLYE
jgi:uncharacterized protein YndB with AHSA1/START domain